MIIKSLKIIQADIQNLSLVRRVLAHYVVLYGKYRSSASSGKTKRFMAEESEIKIRLPIMLSFILIYKERKSKTE